MASDIGTGTTITFGTSSRAFDIVSVDHGGITRESIDMSHLGTSSGRPFTVSDTYDPGELTVELLLDPNFDVLTLPPYDQVAETVTVTVPKQSGDATAGTFAATGLVTNFGFGIPFEDRMTGSATIKLTGDVTFTAGST